MFSSSLFTVLQSVYQAVMARHVASPPLQPQGAHHQTGWESGVRAPTEVQPTSRQLYERRFLFKRRAVVIILSYDVTSCGSQELLHLFHLYGWKDCLQAPSVNVHTNNGGGGCRHYADVICSLLSLNDYRMSSGGLCYPTSLTRPSSQTYRSPSLLAHSVIKYNKSPLVDF